MLSWGDAVGNHVLHLQRILRGRGYASEVFAGRTDEHSRALALPASGLPSVADDETVLLVHHSFESRLLPLLRRTPGRKVVLYHNITPAYLFERFDPKLAAACASARAELYALAELAERGFAYSRFSAEELAAARFREVGVIPIAIDWEGFDVPPDPALQAEFDDGCTNVLFVGRVVPNKRIEDVLRVFTAYQRLYNPRSRLIVAGELGLHSPYAGWIRELRASIGAERVHLLGKVSRAQLSACFDRAHAYLSMSWHEGVGVPLLEAMHRDVPVVAFGAAAVPETLAGAGITVLTSDPVTVAQALAVLQSDPEVRSRVVDRQRRRVAEYDPAAVEAKLSQTLLPALESPPKRAVHRPGVAPVRVVCPGFALEPEDALSKLARAIAVAGGERVELLCLHASRAKGLGPEEAPLGGSTVLSFTAERPPVRGAASPHSSSLETAALACASKLVVLGIESESNRVLLREAADRAWLVLGSNELLPADLQRFPPARVLSLGDLGEQGVLSRLFAGVTDET